jgi:hypothetical protein
MERALDSSNALLGIYAHIICLKTRYLLGSFRNSPCGANLRRIVIRLVVVAATIGTIARSCVEVRIIIVIVVTTILETYSLLTLAL